MAAPLVSELLLDHDDARASREQELAVKAHYDTVYCIATITSRSAESTHQVTRNISP